MRPRLPLSLRSVLELRGYQLTLILHVKLLENRDLLILIPLQHLVKSLKHCRRGNSYLLDSLKLRLPGKCQLLQRIRMETSYYLFLLQQCPRPYQRRAFGEPKEEVDYVTVQVQTFQ